MEVSSDPQQTLSNSARILWGSQKHSHLLSELRRWRGKIRESLKANSAREKGRIVFFFLSLSLSFSLLSLFFSWGVPA